MKREKKGKQEKKKRKLEKKREKVRSAPDSRPPIFETTELPSIIPFSHTMLFTDLGATSLANSSAPPHAPSLLALTPSEATELTL